MAGITIGSVAIEVVPAATNFSSTLSEQLLPQADALGKEIGEEISAGIQESLKDIGIKLDTGQVDAEIEDLKGKLDDVSGHTYSVSLGLDDTRIVAALEDLGEKLDKLSDGIYDIALELRDGNVATSLDDIIEKLDDLSHKDVSPKLTLNDGDFNAQLDKDMAKLQEAGSEGGGLEIPVSGMGAGIVGALAASPSFPGALT